MLNDSEIRQLTGKSSLVNAARELLAMGPSSVIAKQGEYGSALFSKDGYFSLPAYPLQRVRDPTGAGDTFGGGIVGYIASQRGRQVDHQLLSTAMAYGTAAASFSVEEFGTERLVTLAFDEVHARVDELHRIVQFKHPSVEEIVA
jgi:sugar/nucleoside kinase (ribokinase family)